MDNQVVASGTRTLIEQCRQAGQSGRQLPFSIYTSHREQQIFNVPMIQPTLVCVLSGHKHLAEDLNTQCPAGSFVFLSNRPGIAIRNIPQGTEYFALLIAFDYSDFDCFEHRVHSDASMFQGSITPFFEQTLAQFVDWSVQAPKPLWPTRRREILQLIHHLGYTEVSTVAEPPSLSQKLQCLISQNIARDLDAEALSSQVAMSTSTMRRKLRAEGTSLQLIKDQARLSHGLHLIQTSMEPIGRIAERCGYQSQSRFTDKFRQAFGVTPTVLRKTRLPPSSPAGAKSAQSDLVAVSTSASARTLTDHR